MGLLSTTAVLSLLLLPFCRACKLRRSSFDRSLSHLAVFIDCVDCKLFDVRTSELEFLLMDALVSLSTRCVDRVR